MQTRLLVLLGEHVNGKYNIIVDNPVRMSIYSMLKTRVTNDLDNKNIKWSVLNGKCFVIECLESGQSDTWCIASVRT